MDKISILEKRIEKLRAALIDISQVGEGDNPWEPYDRTDNCRNYAKEALLEDDKVK